MEENITCFDDLLHIARKQLERQRLLFVFVGSELPENATPKQKERFEMGDGGALVPIMCVDKLPEELDSFEDLLREARQFENPDQPWVLVFAGAMQGTLMNPPTEEEAETTLNHMIEAIKGGMAEAYLPFNREGEPVQLQHSGRPL